MAPSPKVVEPPKSGLWRVGRSLDPLRFSDPLDPGLSAIADEEEFMALGEVPADWRHRRHAVRVAPTPSDAIPAIGFLDVEAAETRAVLRGELGELLAFHGYSDLDVPTVRGGDRRITRWIGAGAYEQRDANDRMKFAGIRLQPIPKIVQSGSTAAADWLREGGLSAR